MTSFSIQQCCFLAKVYIVWLVAVQWCFYHKLGHIMPGVRRVLCW